MPVPTVRVQVAFASNPDDPGQVWSDISADVRMADGVSITRGRSDEFTDVQPGRLTLTLDNTAGNYTFGYASGAHYPNVLPGKRIRVAVSGDDGGSWSPRFDGYVDGWPTEWAAGLTEQPRVRIGATDRLARFGNMRQLRDALHEELGSAASDQSQGWVLDDATFSVLGDTTVLAGGVVWLYGLQESSGATTAGDVSGASGRPTLTAAQVGAAGAATFGSAGIMPEGTAVEFVPESAGNGVVLAAADAYAYLGTELSLWCQMAWTGSTGASFVTMGTNPQVTLRATPTTVVATFTGVGGATATATAVVATNDNRPHFVLVSVSGSTISLYVDQESAATATVPVGMGGTQGLTVGGATSADAHQMAWVGYANSATTAARAAELASLATGEPERSDLRVARILGWLGVLPDATLESGLSDVAYQAAGGSEALDLVGQINQVEGGVLFATGDGRLAFHSRDHRYNRIPTVSLPAANVSPDGVSVDTGTLVNDYTVSRPRGATYRARDADSIATYGAHSAEATVYAASDEDLRGAADWELAKRSQVAPRISSIGVNMLTSDSVAASVLAAEVGDRVTVTGLPSTTTPGGATVDLYAEGFDEIISHTSWTISVSTSPAWGQVWALDDATFSVLGTSTVLAY